MCCQVRTKNNRIHTKYQKKKKNTAKKTKNENITKLRINYEKTQNKE